MNELVGQLGSVTAAVDYLVEIFRRGRPIPTSEQARFELEEVTKSYGKKLYYQLKKAKDRKVSGQQRKEMLGGTFAQTSDTPLFGSQSTTSTVLQWPDDDQEEITLSQASANVCVCCPSTRMSWP